MSTDTAPRRGNGTSGRQNRFGDGGTLVRDGPNIGGAAAIGTACEGGKVMVAHYSHDGAVAPAKHIRENGDGRGHYDQSAGSRTLTAEVLHTVKTFGRIEVLSNNSVVISRRISSCSASANRLSMTACR